MMSWEQLDKLNAIATDRTKTPEQRTTDIADFMRMWGMLVNEGPDAWDYSPNWDDARIPREPVIDPAKASTHARTTLIGQTGFTAYAGYMDH